MANRGGDFKSEWNAADVYTKTLMTDYWMIKQNLYKGDLEEALHFLIEYFEDLSPVMSDGELDEAEELVESAKRAVRGGGVVTSREAYFNRGKGNGGVKEIRKARRRLLRIQRNHNLLIPGGEAKDLGSAILD